jgi:hypothetical protein
MLICEDMVISQGFQALSEQPDPEGIVMHFSLRVNDANSHAHLPVFVDTVLHLDSSASIDQA